MGRWAAGEGVRWAGGVGLQLWAQVHTEALCSFSDPRPGGKGHLDPNNVGFLCSREAGSHSRTEYTKSSEAEAGQGLGLGVEFRAHQVTLPTMGFPVPSQASCCALHGGSVDTHGWRWGSQGSMSFGLTRSLPRGLHLAGPLS